MRFTNSSTYLPTRPYVLNNKPVSCSVTDRQTDRQTNILATVDGDVLRHDPPLQHSLFGMIPSTAEQTGRFYLEITDLLFVTVDQTETKLLLNLLISSLDSLSYTHRHSEVKQ